MVVVCGSGRSSVVEHAARLLVRHSRLSRPASRFGFSMEHLLYVNGRVSSLAHRVAVPSWCCEMRHLGRCWNRLTCLGPLLPRFPRHID